MFCSNCGTQLAAAANFCANCGLPVPASGQSSAQAAATPSPLQQQILGSWALTGTFGLGLLSPVMTALFKRVQFHPDGTWQNPAMLGGTGGAYSFIGPDEMRLQSPQNVSVVHINVSGDAMIWKRDSQRYEFRREK